MRTQICRTCNSSSNPRGQSAILSRHKLDHRASRVAATITNGPTSIWNLSSIRIGIDSAFMAGQMTGIGNATFELLNALIENYPELNFLQFGDFRWSPFNAADLKRIERRAAKREEDIRPSLRQVLLAGVRRGSSQLKAVRTVYGAARRKTCSRTVASQSLDLFHAFNFMPPADPGIVTLPVIHDLSFVHIETHPKDRLRWLEEPTRCPRQGAVCSNRFRVQPR